MWKKVNLNFALKKKITIPSHATKNKVRQPWVQS